MRNQSRSSFWRTSLEVHCSHLEEKKTSLKKSKLFYVFGESDEFVTIFLVAHDNLLGANFIMFLLSLLAGILFYQRTWKNFSDLLNQSWWGLLSW